MASLTLKLKVFFVLLCCVEIFCDKNPEIGNAVREIFLSKNFNSTDMEWILKSARESYLYLRSIEKKPQVNEKIHFVRNYASFLLKLLKELEAKKINVPQLFAKENSFFKDYNTSQPSQDFNETELKTKIEDLQIAAERILIVHLNSSGECHQASYVLALNETSFDNFLKEKLRAGFSDIGYFILEVFATLIGLSWGLISTVIYYTESTMDKS